MERQVTPPRRVTSPTWGLLPPCKQALKFKIINERQVINVKVEGKQQRTGLSFRVYFLASF